MAKKEMQAEVEAKAAAEAAIFDGWEERFPYYPKWDVGGDHFELRRPSSTGGKSASRTTPSGTWAVTTSSSRRWTR